ncbi:hypothetical protein PS2_015104 [Malus domestica]
MFVLRPLQGVESRHKIPTFRHFRIDIFESSRGGVVESGAELEAKMPVVESGLAEATTKSKRKKVELVGAVGVANDAVVIEVVEATVVVEGGEEVVSVEGEGCGDSALPAPSSNLAAQAGKHHREFRMVVASTKVVNDSSPLVIASFRKL